MGFRKFSGSLKNVATHLGLRMQLETEDHEHAKAAIERDKARFCYIAPTGGQEALRTALENSFDANAREADGTFFSYRGSLLVKR